MFLRERVCCLGTSQNELCPKDWQGVAGVDGGTGTHRSLEQRGFNHNYMPVSWTLLWSSERRSLIWWKEAIDCILSSNLKQLLFWRIVSSWMLSCFTCFWFTFFGVLERLKGKFSESPQLLHAEPLQVKSVHTGEWCFIHHQSRMAFSEGVWKVGVFEPSAQRITVPISPEVPHVVSRYLLDASPKRDSWLGWKPYRLQHTLRWRFHREILLLDTLRFS